MDPKAIADLEEAWTRMAMVATHWLPGSNSIFWYRQWLAADKYRFMLLNCEKGTQQEAFNHEDLALELKTHMGLDLNPDQLPIECIHVEACGSCVYLRLHNTMWTFPKEGRLTESSDEHAKSALGMDFDASKPSPKSLITAEATLTNLTGAVIDYFWVDYNGNSDRRRGGFRPGESVKLVSMLHHRWRLVQNASRKQVVLELKHASGVYTIENRHDSLAASWQKQPFEAASLKSTVSLGDQRGPEYEAFLRQHNVWARDQSRTEWQVSYNGYEDDRYRFVYATPDGLHAVAMQCRSGCHYPFQLKNSIPMDQLRPKVINSPSESGHPRAGDHMDVDRPRLFDLAMAKEIPVDDSLFRNPFSITHIGWSLCGRKYRFIFNERGHQHLRLLEIDLDGKVTMLIEDSSDTVVDYNQKLYYKLLASTSDIIWASERDGWNHLYRFDLETGILKNQITKGDWLVRSVEHVDSMNQQIWFTGYGMIKGQDPYYAQLACVDFDGCNLRLLTRADGTHSWQWGPDQRFLIDTWSRVDLLPHVAVIEVATGKQTIVFQKQDIPSELRGKYHPFERFAAKGRDDTTDIHGVIIRPCDFDERKRYPIIEIIYAAPFQYYTPKRFKNYAKFRDIADSGFVVVVMDGIGTNWRSKAFLDKSYKNLKDAGFPDRIKWIRAAAKTRPWMDINRVGIQGSSSGGQNAAAAVLHHGDFYKAACAEAGTHDNRMGNVKWSEMYMGWPVDASYHDNSNGAHAAKLSSALMLVTGELDEVVDPATTMQFAHALIKADKDFDLVCLPDMGHSCVSKWLDKKKTRFFKTHLRECE